MNTSSANPARILLVDDDKAYTLLLEPYLSMKGYNIQVVNDSMEALDLVKKQRFDLLILDLDMPGVHGIDILKYVKEIDPQTKVIINTGYSDIWNAIEAKGYGADEFMGKFTPDEVISKPLDIDVDVDHLCRLIERNLKS